MDIDEVKLCARLCLTATALCDHAHLCILRAEAEFHDHKAEKVLDKLVEFAEVQIEREVADYWNRVYDALAYSDSD